MTLRADNLRVAIGGKIVCRELNVAIRPGECWGILGQNGTGKTTLLRTLAGLYLPQAGAVSLHDRVLQTYSRQDLARQLAVLLQADNGEFWGSVLEYVLLGRFPHRAALFGYGAEDEAIALQALVQMELAELARRPLNTLSGGERQRAAIAQVLTQQARYYLLDEPLQHLDLRHQAQAMQIISQIKEQGQALLLVLHDTLWAQRCCDHLLLLFADGRVLQGNTHELLTRSYMEELYQCPLLELEVEGGRGFVPGV